MKLLTKITTFNENADLNMKGFLREILSWILGFFLLETFYSTSREKNFWVGMIKLVTVALLKFLTQI